MSFVMKITNFVKSAKTSFLAPHDPKMNESALLYGLAGKAQTAQQHPRDWSRIGNAELLFRRVAEPL